MEVTNDSDLILQSIESFLRDLHIPLHDIDKFGQVPGCCVERRAQDQKTPAATLQGQTIPALYTIYTLLYVRMASRAPTSLL